MNDIDDIKVLKYGGSSLATPDHVNRVAEQVAEFSRRGHRVVVVASAMGDSTASLMSMARDVADAPEARELDKLLSTGELMSTSLLSMAVNRLGREAVSLTGPQCGIVTDDSHFNATIQHVDCSRIRDELSRGRVVVAAGFQGCSGADEVTTLGLGGSDTTAVVLAAALGVSECEICSDVDGIYSADPRVVADAGMIPELSFEEMMTMSRHGASVLNPTAVDQARRHGVAIRSRHTDHPDATGTLVHDLEPEGPRVVGIASHDAVLPLAVPAHDDAGILPEGVDHNDLVMDRRDAGTGHRHIAIPAERLPDAEGYGERLTRRLGDAVQVGEPCSSVSAIGVGVGETPEMQSRSRRISARAGVDTRHHFGAGNAITWLVEPGHAPRLMNAFHGAFQCPETNAV